MVTPSYYKDFHCIADKCRHSCCIGWEIDIDEDSYSRYLSDGSAFGERLRRSISDAPPHFVLGEDERCPFLNEKGLCDIILEKGEDSLCQICRDHPRFYNDWSGMVEAGIGLCCEEAVRVVLSQEKPFTLINDGESIDDGYAQELYNIRSHLIETVFTAKDPEKAVMDEFQINPFSLSIPRWADFYLGFERLDESWTAVLEKLKNSGNFSDKTAPKREYLNLMAYFIYRHFPEALDDDDPASKIGFALLSCRMIDAAYRAGCGEFFELVRMYCSEIEYSEENLSAIYDKLWENQ